jgi:hypothetical protein
MAPCSAPLPQMRLLPPIGLASLAADGEEVFERYCCLFCQNSGGHFYAMVKLGMIEDREARAYRAAFGVWRAINETGDAGLDHSAGAHGAGLDGDVEACSCQTIVADTLCSFAQRDYFGVRGGIAVGDGAVSGAGHDLIIHYHYCADRYFASFGRGAGFIERAAHESRVAVVGNGWNIIDSTHF